MDTSARNRLLALLQRQAVARREVVLSSGRRSNYYIDCRCITLSAEGAFLTAQMMLEVLLPCKVHGIGGLTLGADPIVSAVAALSFARHTPIQAFIVRKASKEHGQRRSIEGPSLPSGARVAIVDDVATTGGSLLQAIQRVQEETDWQIARVLCLVDRQEGARERLGQAGFDLNSIFTGQDLLAQAGEQ
ncbi:orotate phosphoribosyltransferase [Desulfobacca acetoxidans]